MKNYLRNAKRIITALWGDMSIESECGMIRVAYFEDRHIDIYQDLLWGCKRVFWREGAL